jgi:hypothetical protein
MNYFWNYPQVRVNGNGATEIALAHAPSPPRWIPAFAGMTLEVTSARPQSPNAGPFGRTRYKTVIRELTG